MQSTRCFALRQTVALFSRRCPPRSSASVRSGLFQPSKSWSGFSRCISTGISYRSDSGTESGERLKRPESMDRLGGRSKKRPDGPPVTWANAAMTGLMLVLMYGAYRFAANKRQSLIDEERRKEVGKSRIGGTFELVDQTGKTRKSEDFHGKWLLLYFGFTHCPDICPDEMEKMAEVYDILKEQKKSNEYLDDILPVFITVDPERDGVEQVGEYVKEFHPEMIGLTGTVEKVREACKAFRVYFSAGPKDEDDDYIVDHTIIIYLIDPEGQFMDYYGQTKTADQIASSVAIQMAKYSSSKKRALFGF